MILKGSEPIFERLEYTYAPLPGFRDAKCCTCKHIFHFVLCIILEYLKTIPLKYETKIMFLPLLFK